VYSSELFEDDPEPEKELAEEVTQVPSEALPEASGSPTELSVPEEVPQVPGLGGYSTVVENASAPDVPPSRSVIGVRSGDPPLQPAMTSARPAKGNRKPIYPPLAIEKGLEGTVLLEVEIDKEGYVSKVRIIQSSGHSILDRAAERAVKRWKFEITSPDGGPVNPVIEIPIRFTLNEKT
jgi:protein TonB